MLGLVVLLGVGGIIASRGGNRGPTGPGPAPGDHWHAPFGINICGQWKPDFDTSMASGVHSHSDGQIHIEPRSAAQAYTNANLGAFLEAAGGDVTSSSIKLSEGTKLADGDRCPGLDNQTASLRWQVDGNEKPKGSDPAAYVPNDGEVVALAFLPDKVEIGVPPARDRSGGTTPK